MKFLMDYWPSVIYVPAILVVIAALAVTTHFMDKRDESRR